MKSLITVFALLISLTVSATTHPTLLLTKDGVEQIKSSLGTVPQFDVAVAELLSDADAALERPLCVPQPKDGGGGYSHEAHKQNYYDMYYCGLAYQITGKPEYAGKAREIMFAYAELYPTLGYHPLGLSATPGRLFWQTLNESVWLVHTSVAYDCIYDYLSAGDRKHLEKDLFYPMADFLMNGTPDNRANNKVFNKMHNHGTWAVSAVGMIGIAMGDEDLLRKALYGSDGTGKNGGFMMQLDYLFSPDGYFTEGAYYQRYAIWPFVTFAQCIDHCMPELGIFSYRDSIILKAVDALLQLAYDGVFLRFNDALEKGYDAQELIFAVDIAYNADKTNKKLLSVVRDYQKKVLVSDAGYAVAKAIRDGEAEPMVYRSVFFRDGGNGDEGGIALIRSEGEDRNSLVTFKATSHGLSHGHYDKLTVAYYDNGNEIVTDYGASRFLNIEAKYSGHYTKQNKTYAMTTIAHNTLVVDEKSQFGGDIKVSSRYWPEIYAMDLDARDVKYVSAIEENAYPGVRMHRTLVYADIPFLQCPLIMDVLKADSRQEHRYDYPVHYNGQMISLTVPYEKALTEMRPLGTADGYRHLWVEARAAGGDGKTTYTWMTGDRMYSLSVNTTPSTELYLARIGADDPDFNLRPDPVYIVRENGVRSRTFVSCLETHGKYDLQVEQSANLVHSCESVATLLDTAEYTVAEFGFAGGHKVILCIASADSGKDVAHEVNLEDGRQLSWTGPVSLKYE